jgi:hypothetical protein
MTAKGKFEILDDALRCEAEGAKQLLRAFRNGLDSEAGRRELDEACRRWSVLTVDILEELRNDQIEPRHHPSKLEVDFRAGIGRELFSTRALLSLRVAISWALGSRELEVPAALAHFPVVAPGDLLARAMVTMLNPWEYEAVLTGIETRVGEAINAYFLRPERPKGLDSLAQLVLLSRDFLYRTDFVATLANVLEQHHANARQELFRPAPRVLADLLFLATHELIEFGPAARTQGFSRQMLRGSVGHDA